MRFLLQCILLGILNCTASTVGCCCCCCSRQIGGWLCCTAPAHSARCRPPTPGAAASAPAPRAGLRRALHQTGGACTHWHDAECKAACRPVVLPCCHRVGMQVWQASPLVRHRLASSLKPTTAPSAPSTVYTSTRSPACCPAPSTWTCSRICEQQHPIDSAGTGRGMRNKRSRLHNTTWSVARKGHPPACASGQSVQAAPQPGWHGTERCGGAAAAGLHAGRVVAGGGARQPFAEDASSPRCNENVQCCCRGQAAGDLCVPSNRRQTAAGPAHAYLPQVPDAAPADPAQAQHAKQGAARWPDRPRRPRHAAAVAARALAAGRAPGRPRCSLLPRCCCPPGQLQSELPTRLTHPHCTGCCSTPLPPPRCCCLPLTACGHGPARGPDLARRLVPARRHHCCCACCRHGQRLSAAAAAAAQLAPAPTAGRRLQIQESPCETHKP